MVERGIAGDGKFAGASGTLLVLVRVLSTGGRDSNRVAREGINFFHAVKPLRRFPRSA